MSQKEPEPHDSLHVITHAAYILKTPSEDSATVILFSINDGEWMAWYSYREVLVSKRARKEFDDSLNGDHRITLFDDWKHLNPNPFTPTKPRRVDEFAPKGDNGKALLLKPIFHNDKFLTMNLFIFGLKDGPEHFALRMYSGTKPKEMPTNREPGIVTLAGLNLWSRVGSFLNPSNYEPWMTAYLGPAVK